MGLSLLWITLPGSGISVNWPGLWVDTGGGHFLKVFLPCSANPCKVSGFCVTHSGLGLVSAKKSCDPAILMLRYSVCSARERREDVILNPPAIKKIVCLFSARFPWRHVYGEKRHLISWRSLEFTVPSSSIWLMHSCALAHIIPITEEPMELQRGLSTPQVGS